MLEEIMKTYNEMNLSNGKELNFAKARLDRFRDNKEKEISEYLQEVYMNKEDFYDGYGSMIKKDLEQAYAEQEKQMVDEINSIQQNEIVDSRIMAEVKIETSKSLKSFKEQLIKELKYKRLDYDKESLNLSEFKYIYDENHNVLNGSEFKSLYDNVQAKIADISSINKQISDIDSKIEEMKLTQDEIDSMMRSLTPTQQQSYDLKLKSLNMGIQNLEIETKKVNTILSDSKENVASTEETKEEQAIVAEEDFEKKKHEKIEKFINNLKIKDLDKEYENTNEDLNENAESNYLNEINDPYSDIVEPDKFDSAPDSYEDDIDLISEGYSDLYKTVYADVMLAVDNVKSIKLNPGKEKISSEQRYLSTKGNNGSYNINTVVDIPEDEIQIPDGEFINSNDFIEALDTYKKETKGRTFVVKSKDKLLKLTSSGIKKFKKAIKKSSALVLLKENKFSNLDMRRIFAKGFDANEYQQVGESLIENVELKKRKETFISREELMMAMENLFKEKKTSWLSRLKNHISDKKNKSYKAEDYPLELDDEYHLQDNMIDETAYDEFTKTR